MRSRWPPRAMPQIGPRQLYDPRLRSHRAARLFTQRGTGAATGHDRERNRECDRDGRLERCLRSDHGTFMTRGFDHTAQLAFSHNAAAGRLLGMTESEIANAIAMAASSDASDRTTAPL